MTRRKKDRSMTMLSLLEATRGEYEWGKEGSVMDPDKLKKVKKALSDPLVHALAKTLAELPGALQYLFFRPEVIRKKYGVELAELRDAVVSQDDLRKSRPSRASGDFEESPLNSNEEKYYEWGKSADRDKDRVARTNRTKRRQKEKLSRIGHDDLTWRSGDF